METKQTQTAEELQAQLGAPECLAVRGRSEPLAVLHVERPSALWSGAIA